MKHEEIFLRLGAFVDNELPDIVKNEVENHLKSCAECSREAQAIKEQALYMKKDKGLTPLPYFAAKFQAVINEKATAKPGFSIGKLIPVPLGLSLVVLIFSAYMIAAPLLYAINNDSLKSSAKEMAKDLAVCCVAGSVFAPAAFAKFCGKCTMNACACCGKNCSMNCKNGGNKNGK